MTGSLSKPGGVYSSGPTMLTEKDSKRCLNSGELRMVIYVPEYSGKIQRQRLRQREPE